MSRRGGSHAHSIQLLPFLDILTCTMGALVTLLFAFARYGQQQVDIVSDAKQEAVEAASAEEVEDLQWRAEMLRQSRAQTEADLHTARLELSHLEDHTRRLREQADQLNHAAEALENADDKTARLDDDELKQLKNQIARSQQELDEAKKKVTGKPATYSIVPYVGPNQTGRRPIYLECREGGIVLEPEGILFTDEDFQVFGPGNPVAAAVRAAREYMAASDPNSLDQIEPYPLLIVRPNAIAQYYAARMALQSFGSQFGYELLGSDKVLKFPEPDRQLAEKLKLVVAEARIRQQQVIAAAPSQYRKRHKPNFSVNGNGRVQQEPEPGAPTGNGRNPYLGIQTGRRGGGGGNGQGGVAGGNGQGGPGGPGTGGLAQGNGNGGANLAPGGSGTGLGSGATGGFGAPGTSMGPDGTIYGGTPGAGGFYGSGNGPNGVGGGPGGGGPNGTGGAYAAGGGMMPGGQNGTNGQGGQGGQVGPDGQPLGLYPSGGYPPGGNMPGGPNGNGTLVAANGLSVTPGAPGSGAAGAASLATPGGVQGGTGFSLSNNGSMGGGNGNNPNGAGGPNSITGANGVGGVPGAMGGGPAGGVAGTQNGSPGAGQGTAQANGGDGQGGDSPGAAGQGGTGPGGSNAGRIALAGNNQSQTDEDNTGGGSPNATPLTTTQTGGGSAAAAGPANGPGTGPGGGGLGGYGGNPIGNSQSGLMPKGPPGRGGGPAANTSRVTQVTNPSGHSIGGPADDTGDKPTDDQNNNSASVGGNGGASGSQGGLLNSANNLYPNSNGYQSQNAPGSGNTNSRTNSSQTAQNSQSGQSGQSSGSQSSQSGQSGQSGQNGGSSSGDPTQQQAGIPNPLSMIMNQQNQPPPQQNQRRRSLAQSRSSGWALPDSKPSSVPVARPVVIQCFPDKLVILGDDAKTPVKTIPMGQQTEDSVDELVSSVWGQMKKWGSAGNGSYWKPSLKFRIAQGAQGRFEELQTLLADSGMDVKESASKAPIASGPGAVRK